MSKLEIIREFDRKPQASWWDYVKMVDGKYQYRLMWSYVIDLALFFLFLTITVVSILAGIWNGSGQWIGTGFLFFFLALGTGLFAMFRRG